MKIVGAVIGFIGLLWFFWSSAFAGFTIFLYLAQQARWDFFWSYATSVLGLMPLIGWIVATFMSDSVHGWGFLHAAGNFFGGFVLIIVAGLMTRNAASR